MNAEIIAVGSELLTPHRQDTNSLYLTEKLNDLGVEVRFKCIVGDDFEGLAAAAKLAMRRSDIIIFSGGLGPTEDDLTREAVADALGLKLQRDPLLMAKLEERFAKRGMKMAANNAKQADILSSATVLPNPLGTAPGQWIGGKYDGQERILMLLPGPPYELKALFETECIPRLRARIPVQHIATAHAQDCADAGIASGRAGRADLQNLSLTSRPPFWRAGARFSCICAAGRVRKPRPRRASKNSLNKSRTSLAMRSSRAKVRPSSRS